MSLKEYSAKRNFLRTNEPAGRPDPNHKKHALSFVVQKHAASHLHYDFRLEMGGVLRSWAVPKGFPFQRGERRLAIEVEDHPVEYGGFEGIIPEGNYGAGVVMLWDRGPYTVSGDDPVKAWQEGKIHMALMGKKLKGEWTLVRLRSASASKPQWLLLKSGKDLPRLSSRVEDHSVLSNRSLHQIAQARRPREWVSNPENSSENQSRTLAKEDTSPRSRRRFSHKTIPNRSQAETARSAIPSSVSTRPGLALRNLPSRKPGFVEPMKAQLVADLPKGSEWLYEIKFDGVRALAIKDRHSIRLLSRSGKDLTNKYDTLLEGLRQLPAKEVVLDGEIVAVDVRGRSGFQLLQSYQSAGSRKPPLFYYVFDVIQLDKKDLTTLPLSERKKIAEGLLTGLAPLRFSASIKADSQRVMREMRARGLEGLIAKKKDSRYEPGRRSGAWAKIKWTNEQEFVIGGYTFPQGSRSHFGAILVGYYEEDQLRFAAKVGTGFNERTLQALYQKFQKLTQPKCPFSNLPERSSAMKAGLSAAEMKRCTWLRPQLVCQVRFAEWTRDHHLRQPAFLGLREDKTAREVVRETTQ